MAKTETSERIRWAPKVYPSKIRRLYEVEASGLLTDGLVDLGPLGNLFEVRKS